MAYDERLAERVRGALSPLGDVREVRMFGGLCFMVNGSMCCGVLGQELCARVGPERLAEALSKRHARPMDFTGTPSRNMVYVAPAGLRTPAALGKWLDWSVGFAITQARNKARVKRQASTTRQRAARATANRSG